jgi:hypothetical protein
VVWTFHLSCLKARAGHPSSVSSVSGGDNLNPRVPRRSGGDPTSPHSTEVALQDPGIEWCSENADHPMSKNQHGPTPRRSCNFRSEDLQPTSSSKPKVPPSSIASTSGDRGTMPQISGRMPEHMVVYWHTTLAHYTGHYTGTRPYSFTFHLCQKMLSSWLLLPLTEEPEYKTNSSFCNFESSMTLVVHIYPIKSTHCNLLCWHSTYLVKWRHYQAFELILPWHLEYQKILIDQGCLGANI